jgi:hypothetical protein
MFRSLIVGLAVAMMAASDALAQSCAGNPVAVQVLGSGAPGFVRDRANTSYLLWIGNQAKILVDAGGGAYVRFGQVQAKFSDLAMILVSHLHPDPFGRKGDRRQIRKGIVYATDVLGSSRVVVAGITPSPNSTATAPSLAGPRLN